jgi:uncharacterized protein (DUF1697 family)
MWQAAAMTERHIALLRGINVGGHNKITTARQRALTEQLGYTDVVVYLQTGNIIFSAADDVSQDEAGGQLKAALREETGADISVIMRGRDELAAEIGANPYPEAASEPKSLHLLFLAAPLADTSRLDALDLPAFAPDSFRLIGKVLYLHTPGGYGRSKLAESLAPPRLGGATVTARNWNTAVKLLELAG